MEFKWMFVLFLLETSFPTKMNATYVIKTIHSEDGDIIDCTDIYKQPAFQHPALRHHKIQLKPTFDVETEREGGSTTMTSQLWHKSNGSCPKGTIPIRRRRHLNSQHTRKQPMFRNSESKGVSLMLQNHSLAILHTEGYAYLGAKADIKVWNPRVELDDEYTTSQVALKSGPYYSYESVEAGWAVNPKVYGDRQTRLFVYWTADSSKTTGCFDITCPGFVQTSHEIAVGGAIYPISNPTGLPYQITIYIHKDPKTRNWWVQYGESIDIGYWPAELLDMLNYNAETVQWGGEVYSTRVGTSPHTATEMGSGKFSDYVMQTSGAIQRMRVRLNGGILKFPDWVNAFSEEYRCYDVYYIHDYVLDPEFYYGGPGRNPLCP